MRTLHPRLSSHRRFMWLLWLVLLLPMAQTAASLHGLSHATSDLARKSSPVDGKQAIERAHCELCMTGASLVGAAPASAPPQAPQLATAHPIPPTISADVWLAPTATAYQSRAPPFSLL